MLTISGAEPVVEHDGDFGLGLGPGPKWSPIGPTARGETLKWLHLSRSFGTTLCTTVGTTPVWFCLLMATVKAHKRSVLDELLAKGLVEPAKESPARFQLTGKALHLLAKRGVGISGG
jgi:hypothetical protein